MKLCCTRSAKSLLRITTPPKRAPNPRRFVAMASSSSKKELWAAPVCPYAQRAWISVEETGAPFEYKIVDLHDKAPEFVALYRKIVSDESANAKVPVLIDGDLEITESPVVAEYVLRAYGSSSSDILPSDPGALARARLWAELFSSNVGPAQSAILKSDTKAKLAEGEQQMARALSVLDAVLRNQGSQDGGSYFLGGQYSVAEVLTTSLLQRALSYCSAYRSVDLWQLVQEGGLVRMEAWMKAAVERPSAKATKPDEEELLVHGKKFTVPMQD